MPFENNREMSRAKDPTETPLECFRADVSRVYGRFQLAALATDLLRERTLRPLMTLRLCQTAARVRPSALSAPMGLVCRAFHHRITGRMAMDLAWSTEIGAGFRIAHGWGLVISPFARIGRNVTVFHGVTIGQRDDIADDGSRTTSYPTIEDDVWIGPHSIVVGGVTVGRGSRIAPHTVVLTDVPPGTIVGGNPMRTIRENAPADVVNPVLPRDVSSPQNSSGRDE
jgi:serine O-acetyltransferase